LHGSVKLRAFNIGLTPMIADKIIEIGATGLEDPAEISKRVVNLLMSN
jgi:hypothetical protein